MPCVSTRKTVNTGYADRQPTNFVPKDIIAGNVALDFVNTVTARDTTPLDWLDGYARLIEWAALAGLLDSRVAAIVALPGRRRAARGGLPRSHAPGSSSRV